MSDFNHGHPQHEMQEPTVAREVLSETEERFDRWRKVSGVFLTPLAFFITYALCTGLSPEGRTLSAILAAMAILWVTEPLPLPVTALLGAVLCVLLGVAPAKTVMAYFADPIVFVFIGGFIIARAMTHHRLDRRIAMAFMSIDFIGRSPAMILAGMGLITALLSMWVSNTATTAMMLPIALGVLSALHHIRVARGEASGPLDYRNWPYATGMMLMVAYAASIGGIGTPVGSPPNLIGIGLIHRATGYQVNFFTWMLLCIPIFALMAVALFFLLYWLHPMKKRGAAAATPAQPPTASPASSPSTAPASMVEYLQREKDALGPWTSGQVNTLIAFLTAVVLWILPGILSIPWFKDIPWAAGTGKWLNARVPESTAALIGAMVLFMLPTDLKRGKFTITWTEAVKIDWGTILLFGGGLAIGTLMFDTGVADALGKNLTGFMGASSLWSLTAVAIALGIVLSETTSNTASANMVVPVAIALAKAADISPIPPALGAVLGASYGFMLPVSTPPNAIVYGSGLVPIPAMIRAGILFDIIGFALIWLGLRLLCPLLGLA